MRFLTSCVLAASSLALGCGARSDVDRVDWGHDAHGALDGSGIEAGDAGASDDGDAGDGDAASCPRGRSASPLLVAHLGLRPTVRRGAQTADELVTAVSTTVDGVGSYRVVAVSKCGAVREILAGEPHAPAPNYTSLTIQGDTLFMANSGGVFSAPASGGVPHLVAAAPGLGVFAVDDAFVYVSTSDHHVVRTPRDGGPLVDIASHGGLDIAVDDTFIYVVDEQRRLLRITKADTTQVTVLAEAVSGNSGYWWDTGWLAQDATRVFFASPSPGTRVCAIPKTGGAPSCTAPLAASSLVWSGALYFATTSGIDRLGNMAVAPTAISMVTPGAMWVDGASVWWLTMDGDLFRVDK